MSVVGYYRWPTLSEHELVFVSEDDLWSCPPDGGSAFRLTDNRGQCRNPVISPDGTRIAYSAREEGPLEVYCMPLSGGAPLRVTYTANGAYVCGWTPNGRIVFSSSHGQPHHRVEVLFAVDPEGGLPEELPYGPATSIAFGPRLIIGRNTEDPARWKRYRGGAKGVLWREAEDDDGSYSKLLELEGNLACPQWIGARVYFISDHEGHGNLYSCDGEGAELRRETTHQDFYVRHARAHGTRIAYVCGAALWIFDSQTGASRKLDVQLRSTRSQCARRFASARRYFENAELHPQGSHLALTVRGKLLACGNWDGPVAQLGAAQGVRYRMASYLEDGERVLCVADSDGEERLELHAHDGSKVERLGGLDIGITEEYALAPDGRRIALANHRHELLLIDLEEAKAELLERNPSAPLQDLEFSPDGSWLCYSSRETRETRSIVLRNLATGERLQATPPLFHDISPSFDPQGRYLYFLSCRKFHHGLESFFHDPEFRSGMRPYLVLLRDDLRSPFEDEPRPLESCDDEKPEEDDGEAGGPPTPGDGDKADGDKQADSKPPEPEPLRIDSAGLQHRVLPFPVAEGQYGQISGLKDKVLYTVFPVDPPEEEDEPQDEKAPGLLRCYDLKQRKEELLLDGLTGFSLSLDLKTLILHTGEALRVLKAGEKPPECDEDVPGRASGTVDWKRLRVEVEPRREWAQMFRETWRLQRDYFWVEDMGGVDWQACYQRYAPLVERVGCRSEFSDLVWDLHGELGTSHAYERGGDYQRPPSFPLGQLGADFVWQDEPAGYRITRILRGECWDAETRSPLAAPGIDVRAGDVLQAVDQVRLGKRLCPLQALVLKAETRVRLTLWRDGEELSREVACLRGETPLRYREWVLANRRRVHERSQGRVGYVHVPNMGASGYSDFMRHYFSEWNRGGLIVDVRFNAGGNVSQLILGRLTRKRLGYDVSRWEDAPEPYPSESVRGPLVALCNEHSGSDGDIFCHSFQLMELGPLVGTRTWGGVIGILPRCSLVDGSLTTQPEFAFWSLRDGWGIENRGVQPDVSVDVPPGAPSQDPQLETAIDEALRRLAKLPALPEGMVAERGRRGRESRAFS